MFPNTKNILKNWEILFNITRTRRFIKKISFGEFEHG